MVAVIDLEGNVDFVLPRPEFEAYADPEAPYRPTDTELVGDLGLSSLKIMDLLLEVEDRFDVSVPMNILPDVNTVRDFAQQLEKLTSNPA